ncbi:MAG: DNA-3-methyladenine glycosylase [Desulfobacteraceae bacterium]|nr:DNA-3-methyladenine glycosylase [Desulfobacteraceae bacterium]
MKPMGRDFYDRPADAVAKDLLGKYLVHDRDAKVRIGKIVETEAYLGSHDLASHSSKKKTRRTEVMFGPSGFAYVYLVYGMHHLLNVVTGPGENASAVLIRALEPVKNLEDRTRGPGLVCRAMNIDKSVNGLDLTGSRLYIAAGPETGDFNIAEKPRIGVGYAGSWAQEPLRFFISASPYVSKLK